MSESTSSVLSMYARIFRNPAAIIFFILFFLGYSALLAVITSEVKIDILELVKAAPFAVSAIVLGVFSIIFWALNYIGKAQKHELKIKEAEELFRVRKNIIDEVFNESYPEASIELSTLKAHLLLAGGEIEAEPEVPSTNMAFDYPDAVKVLLRRS